MKLANVLIDLSSNIKRKKGLFMLRVRPSTLFLDTGSILCCGELEHGCVYVDSKGFSLKLVFFVIFFLYFP